MNLACKKKPPPHVGNNFQIMPYFFWIDPLDHNKVIYIPSRIYIDSGQKIYIFWPEDIYLVAGRYISSGQKIYISFVINHTYIFWPEDIYLLDRRYMLRCCEVRTWNWTKSNHPILVSSDFVVFFVFRGPKYDDIRPNDTKKTKTKTKNNQKSTLKNHAYLWTGQEIF